MFSKLAHIYTLFKRLTIPFSLFIICRFLFYWSNADYFNEVMAIDFIHGLRFDAAAIAMWFLPFIGFQLLPHPYYAKPIFEKWMRWLFHTANTICVGLNVIDIGYFHFTLKRTTFDILHLIGVGNDIVMQAPVMISDFWYLIVLFALLIWISVLLYIRIPAKELPLNSTKSYLLHLPITLFFAAIVVYTSRGGFQLKPISIIQAGTYSDARNIPLVLNTPFTFIKTIKNHGLQEVNYYTQDSLNEIYSPIHQFNTKPQLQHNVVVIILESFSREYIGSLNPRELKLNKDDRSYTPFLDSLIQHSLAFTNCYANGKKSIEGVPAVTAGIPTLMNNPYTASPYSGNRINSLASELRKVGYHTAFFHGGINGTMGFDAYAKTAQYQEYYGKTEYNNDDHFDGNWGIYDEEFFQYFAHQLNEFKAPFLGTILSLSSHQPYTLPQRYKNRFEGGKLPIFKSVEYSDFALKQFFENASKMTWYDSTLFVITADHSSLGAKPFYKTATGQYAIPLVFFHPNKKLEQLNPIITNQSDIMPSILHYLGYNKKFVAFGNSLFDSTYTGYSVNYLNNLYQIIMDGHAFQFDGKQGTSLYNMKTDPFLKKNILNSHPVMAKKLETKLKAIIQSYNQRVLQNNMIAE